jgi:glycosyltransferase involved in cell wall biosynthesis
MANISFSSLLIVVPTLNSYSHLSKLVSSLQKQTWPYWRVVFIDGLSVPDHRQWLEQCCASELRCSWIQQKPASSGIFGAMNLGFIRAAPDDWLLFWGSDDWASSPVVLEKAFVFIQKATTRGEIPDLLVCRGRYVDTATNLLTRPTYFRSACSLDITSYRQALLLGSTPPHQATLFGPGARRFLPSYSPEFRLSADLDYFLQLMHKPGLHVQCLDLEIVHMAAGGVSAQQTRRRLQEVSWAYRRAFGWRWWFPFIARYVRRAASLLEWSR